MRLVLARAMVLTYMLEGTPTRDRSTGPRRRSGPSRDFFLVMANRTDAAAERLSTDVSAAREIRLARCVAGRRRGRDAIVNGAVYLRDRKAYLSAVDFQAEF
jgi:hypothetical protein